jgi:hypothetical protein
MNKAYDIELKLSSIPLDRFKYPCESTTKWICSDRKVYIHEGGLYSSYFVDKFHEIGVNIVSDLNKATDVIILPNTSDNSKDVRTYFDEIYYYHNILHRCWTEKNSSVKKIITVLPFDSDVCSTQYKDMADYATLCYVHGLSGVFARKNKNVFSVLTDIETVSKEYLFQFFMYLLSSNPNHIVGRDFKLQ